MSHLAAFWCRPALLAVVCVAGCRPPAPAAEGRQPGMSRHTASRDALGTTFRVTLYAPDARTAAAALEASFERLDGVDRALNPDRPDGELAAVNAAGEGVPVRVSDDLFAVLQQAQRLSAATHGAYDVTAGPYADLWRRASAAGRAPAQAELEAARLRVGWDKLKLNAIERTATLTVPGMRLDPAGVARGYAADAIFRQLRRQGLEGAKVDAGGVVVVGDPPPGRSGWRVAMPELAGSRGETAALDLTRIAVAVSPNARLPGDRWAAPSVGVPRLIDPVGGRAMDDRPAAVVLANSGAAAESAAAAAAVMGPSGSQAVAAAGGGARVRFLTPAPPRRGRTSK